MGRPALDDLPMYVWSRLARARARDYRECEEFARRMRATGDLGKYGLPEALHRARAAVEAERADPAPRP